MSNSSKDVIRFWQKVSRVGVDSCWHWTGRRCRDGYGRFRYKGKEYQAHRIAFGLFNQGQQPDVVLHNCDNPGCCNPAHLAAGDAAANVADKVTKDRQAKGEANGRSKLTEAEVRSIRIHRMFDLTPPSELARSHGVTKWVIRDIESRKTWKHVEPFKFEELFG